MPPALAAKWPHVFGPADEAEDAEAAEAALCAKLASMNAEEAVLTYYTPEERAAYARIQLQNVQLLGGAPPRSRSRHVGARSARRPPIHNRFPYLCAPSLESWLVYPGFRGRDVTGRLAAAKEGLLIASWMANGRVADRMLWRLVQPVTT